jgi:hypothetical protein
MKASFGAKLLRTAILTAIFAGLFWIQLGTPDPASARTRPPIELGDPDDTGNQATLPNPREGAKATAITASNASPKRNAFGQATSGVTLILVRSLLVAWRVGLQR